MWMLKRLRKKQADSEMHSMGGRVVGCEQFVNPCASDNMYSLRLF